MDCGQLHEEVFFIFLFERSTKTTEVGVFDLPNKKKTF